MKTKIYKLKVMLIITITHILVSTSLAQTNQWQQVAKRTQAQKTAGLAGGEGWQRVTNASYAPSNANIVYSCLDTDGAWKSSDGGTSWIRLPGFPASGGLSLAVDPTNANIVYVAGSSFLADNGSTIEGVIRTADGGNTWTLVKAAHFHAAYTYGGHHIAFGTNTTNIYAAPSTGGILKSTNGTTWNLLLTSGGASILSTLNLYSIQAHPTDNTILFVSATNGLYKIVDNGVSATVTLIGAGLPAGSVYRVQINPSTPNTMYVAAGANGVYQSTDGGLNFSARNNGLSSVISAGGQAKYIAMSPANSNRLFVTFENTGTGLFGKQLYYTNDGGANWTQTSSMDEQNADGWVAGSIFGWTTNLSGMNTGNRWITFHPTDQNIALVHGFGGCIKKTIDGGVTWKYSNTGFTGAVAGGNSMTSAIGWDGTNSNRASFSHSDFGTLITTNNEDVFTNITAGASYSGRTATHSIAMNGNIIVETVGQYGPVAVFVSRNSGTSWTNTGATHTTDMEFVSFHPQNSNIVYAGKYRFDNIVTSDVYTPLSVQVKGIYKGNGDIVYSHNGNSTIYKSIDKGATWTSPYPTLGLTGYYINQIAIDPTDQNRIYASVRGKGVYIINNTTANGGTAVLKNNLNGITLDQFGACNMSSVVVDPNDANIVYAGTYAAWAGHSNGVFRSIDKGLTWTNINGNMGSCLDILNLSINPFNSYVYLSSFGGSWKLPPPGTVTDITPPSVIITSPTTGTTYSTTLGSITLSGTASDNVGVTSVIWTNSANSTSGTASGTTSWSIANISLVSGNNPIIVTARDAANLTSTDMLTVTYTPTTTVKSITIKKTSSPFTIDGNLNEYQWTGNTNESISGTIQGTPNNTANFGAVYDDTYLYLAAKILDTNLINDSPNPWEDDGIEIYLDANHNHLTSYELLYDRQIIKGWNETTIWEKNSNVAGIQHSYTNINGGYTIELAIPWTNLNIIPSSGDTLGFDIQQNDDDNGSARDHALTWNNILGNNYLSTANFGHLILSPDTIPQPIVVKSIIVKKTASPFSIDGNLNEYQWTNNTNESIPVTLQGTPNNTASFGAVYDDTYLYLGAKILDPNLINDSPNAWEDDGIEIYLDANHNHLTSYENLYDRQITKGWNDATVSEKNNNTAGIQHAFSNISGGYTIELAIPWTNINIVPASGDTLGFDVQQNDDDNGSTRDHALSWNNLLGNNYLSTANFGHLILSPDFFSIPPSVLMSSNVTICSGQTTTISAVGSGTVAPYTYLWSPNNGSLSDVTISNPVASPANTTIYTVTVTDGLLSTDTGTVTVTVNPVPQTPTITANGATSFCQGDSVLLTATIADPVAYQWSDSSITQSIYVTSAGNYFVTVTDGNGCSATSASSAVTVNPTATSAGTATICSGDNIFLQGAFQTTAGTYYDTLQTINGCDSILATTLTVNPLPLVNLGNDTVCSTCSITLNADNAGAAYLWSTGETTQTITVFAAGTYSVNVTDVNNCFASDTLVISTWVGIQSAIGNQQTVAVYPNPSNGKFIVETKSGIIVIYNILGENVFQSVITNQKYEIDLSAQPKGMYFYQVTNEQQLIGNGKIIIQ